MSRSVNPWLSIIGMRRVVAGLLILGASVAAAGPRQDFLNGIDLGYWPYLSGTKLDSPAWSKLVWRKPKPTQAWFDGRTKIKDLPAWFARQGVNTMRLRVWTDDTGPYGISYTLEQARAAVKAGLGLYPVLFLSDQWADLGKQPRPAAWADLTHDRLVAAVHDHAAMVARRFRDAGLPVVLWGVGNESDFGVCGAFPEHGIANVLKPELEKVWAAEAELLAAAMAGIRSVDPAARISVHLGMAWVEDFLKGWLGFMDGHGVAFDVIGISYYPSSGPMQSLKDLVEFDSLLNRLHAAFNKPIVIPEYAFPHTTDCSRSLFPDFCGLSWGKVATPSTQSMQVARFLAWALTTPTVLGVFYWSPEWYAPSLPGSPEAGWGPLAVFGPDGRALPASRAFAIGRTTRRPVRADSRSPHSGSGPTVLTVAPACGVTGYALATEYVFGAGGNVRNLDDLRRLFTHDAPWGRINFELQKFEPFNGRNFAFEEDGLALTGIHDGSTNYSEFGHITSGALLSVSAFSAPCIVECVAKQPSGRGCWPSLWLYDTHSGRHDASEIDVLESQNNPPKDDRSMVYQNDHGPGVGEILGNPGKVDRWGWWRPYGPMPGGDMSTRYAVYSVVWLPDRVTKYVDGMEAVTRQFKWTGPASANILAYLSIGSAKLDWPGPVLPETFTQDHAVFHIKSIRVFKPVE